MSPIKDKYFSELRIYLESNNIEEICYVKDWEDKILKFRIGGIYFFYRESKEKYDIIRYDSMLENIELGTEEELDFINKIIEEKFRLLREEEHYKKRLKNLHISKDLYKEKYKVIGKIMKGDYITIEDNTIKEIENTVDKQDLRISLLDIEGDIDGAKLRDIGDKIPNAFHYNGDIKTLKDFNL